MKGRKHELNYPFDPAAVSDPACWLSNELGEAINARTTKRVLSDRLPVMPATPGILYVTQAVTLPTTDGYTVTDIALSDDS